MSIGTGPIGNNAIASGAKARPTEHELSGIKQVPPANPSCLCYKRFIVENVDLNSQNTQLESEPDQSSLISTQEHEVKGDLTRIINVVADIKVENATTKSETVVIRKIDGVKQPDPVIIDTLVFLIETAEGSLITRMASMDSCPGASQLKSDNSITEGLMSRGSNSTYSHLKSSDIEHFKGRVIGTVRIDDKFIVYDNAIIRCETEVTRSVIADIIIPEFEHLQSDIDRIVRLDGFITSDNALLYNTSENNSLISDQTFASGDSFHISWVEGNIILPELEHPLGSLYMHYYISENFESNIDDTEIIINHIDGEAIRVSLLRGDLVQQDAILQSYPQNSLIISDQTSASGDAFHISWIEGNIILPELEVLLGDMYKYFRISDNLLANITDGEQTEKLISSFMVRTSNLTGNIIVNDAITNGAINDIELKSDNTSTTGKLSRVLNISDNLKTQEDKTFIDSEIIITRWITGDIRYMDNDIVVLDCIMSRQSNILGDILSNESYTISYPQDNKLYSNNSETSGLSYHITEAYGELIVVEEDSAIIDSIVNRGIKIDHGMIVEIPEDVLYGLQGFLIAQSNVIGNITSEISVLYNPSEESELISDQAKSNGFASHGFNIDDNIEVIVEDEHEYIESEISKGAIGDGSLKSDDATTKPSVTVRKITCDSNIKSDELSKVSSYVEDSKLVSGISGPYCWLYLINDSVWRLFVEIRPETDGFGVRHANIFGEIKSDNATSDTLLSRRMYIDNGIQASSSTTTLYVEDSHIISNNIEFYGFGSHGFNIDNDIIIYDLCEVDGFASHGFNIDDGIIAINNEDLIHGSLVRKSNVLGNIYSDHATTSTYTDSDIIIDNVTTDGFMVRISILTGEIIITDVDADGFGGKVIRTTNILGDIEIENHENAIDGFGSRGLNVDDNILTSLATMDSNTPSNIIAQDTSSNGLVHQIRYITGELLINEFSMSGLLSRKLVINTDLIIYDKASIDGKLSRKVYINDTLYSDGAIFQSEPDINDKESCEATMNGFAYFIHELSGNNEADDAHLDSLFVKGLKANGFLSACAPVDFPDQFSESQIIQDTPTRPWTFEITPSGNTTLTSYKNLDEYQNSQISVIVDPVPNARIRFNCEIFSPTHYLEYFTVLINDVQIFSSNRELSNRSLFTFEYDIDDDVETKVSIRYQRFQSAGDHYVRVERFAVVDRRHTCALTNGLLYQISDLYGSLISDDAVFDGYAIWKRTLYGDIESTFGRLLSSPTDSKLISDNNVIDAKLSSGKVLYGIKESFVYDLSNAIQNTPDAPWNIIEVNNIYFGTSYTGVAEKSEIIFEIPGIINQHLTFDVYWDFQDESNTNDSMIIEVDGEEYFNSNDVEYFTYSSHFILPAHTKVIKIGHYRKDPENDSRTSLRDLRISNEHIRNATLFGDLYDLKYIDAKIISENAIIESGTDDSDKVVQEASVYGLLHHVFTITNADLQIIENSKSTGRLLNINYAYFDMISDLSDAYFETHHKKNIFGNIQSENSQFLALPDDNNIVSNNSDTDGGLYKAVNGSGDFKAGAYKDIFWNVSKSNITQDTPDYPWVIQTSSSNQIIATSANNLPQKTESKISFMVKPGYRVFFNFQVFSPKHEIEYFSVLVDDEVVFSSNYLLTESNITEFDYEVSTTQESKVSLRYYRSLESDIDQVIVKRLSIVKYQFVETLVNGELYKKSYVDFDTESDDALFDGFGDHFGLYKTVYSRKALVRGENASTYGELRNVEKLHGIIEPYELNLLDSVTTEWTTTQYGNHIVSVSPEDTTNTTTSIWFNIPPDLSSEMLLTVYWEVQDVNDIGDWMSIRSIIDDDENSLEYNLFDSRTIDYNSSELDLVIPKHTTRVFIDHNKTDLSNNTVTSLRDLVLSTAFNRYASTVGDMYRLHEIDSQFISNMASFYASSDNNKLLSNNALTDGLSYIIHEIKEADIKHIPTVSYIDGYGIAGKFIFGNITITQEGKASANLRKISNVIGNIISSSCNIISYVDNSQLISLPTNTDGIISHIHEGYGSFITSNAGYWRKSLIPENIIQDTPEYPWYIEKYNHRVIGESYPDLPWNTYSQISFFVPNKSYINIVWDVMSPLLIEDYFTILSNNEVIFSSSSLTDPEGFSDFEYYVDIENWPFDDLPIPISIRYTRYERSNIDQAFIDNIFVSSYSLRNPYIQGKLSRVLNISQELESNINILDGKISHGFDIIENLIAENATIKSDHKTIDINAEHSITTGLLSKAFNMWGIGDPRGYDLSDVYSVNDEYPWTISTFGKRIVGSSYYGVCDSSRIRLTVKNIYGQFICNFSWDLKRPLDQEVNDYFLILRNGHIIYNSSNFKHTSGFVSTKFKNYSTCQIDIVHVKPDPYLDTQLLISDFSVHEDTRGKALFAGSGHKKLVIDSNLITGKESTVIGQGALVYNVIGNIFITELSTIQSHNADNKLVSYSSDVDISLVRKSNLNGDLTQCGMYDQFIYKSFDDFEQYTPKYKWSKDNFIWWDDYQIEQLGERLTRHLGLFSNRHLPADKDSIIRISGKTGWDLSFNYKVFSPILNLDYFSVFAIDKGYEKYFIDDFIENKKPYLVDIDHDGFFKNKRSENLLELIPISYESNFGSDLQQRKITFTSLDDYKIGNIQFKHELDVNGFGNFEPRIYCNFNGELFKTLYYDDYHIQGSSYSLTLSDIPGFIKGQVNTLELVLEFKQICEKYSSIGWSYYNRTKSTCTSHSQFSHTPPVVRIGSSSELYIKTIAQTKNDIHHDIIADNVDDAVDEDWNIITEIITIPEYGRATMFYSLFLEDMNEHEFTIRNGELIDDDQNDDDQNDDDQNDDDQNDDSILIKIENFEIDNLLIDEFIFDNSNNDESIDLVFTLKTRNHPKFNDDTIIGEMEIFDIIIYTEETTDLLSDEKEELLFFNKPTLNLKLINYEQFYTNALLKHQYIWKYRKQVLLEDKIDEKESGSKYTIIRSSVIIPKYSEYYVYCVAKPGSYTISGNFIVSVEKFIDDDAIDDDAIDDDAIDDDDAIEYLFEDNEFYRGSDFSDYITYYNNNNYDIEIKFKLIQRREDQISFNVHSGTISLTQQKYIQYDEYIMPMFRHESYDEKEYYLNYSTKTQTNNHHNYAIILKPAYVRKIPLCSKVTNYLTSELISQPATIYGDNIKRPRVLTLIGIQDAVFSIPSDYEPIDSCSWTLENTLKYPVLTSSVFSCQNSVFEIEYPRYIENPLLSLIWDSRNLVQGDCFLVYVGNDEYFNTCEFEFYKEQFKHQTYFHEDIIEKVRHFEEDIIRKENIESGMEIFYDRLSTGVMDVWQNHEIDSQTSDTLSYLDYTLKSMIEDSYLNHYIQPDSTRSWGHDYELYLGLSSVLNDLTGDYNKLRYSTFYNYQSLLENIVVLLRSFEYDEDDEDNDIDFTYFYDRVYNLIDLDDEEISSLKGDDLDIYNFVISVFANNEISDFQGTHEGGKLLYDYILYETTSLVGPLNEYKYSSAGQQIDLLLGYQPDNGTIRFKLPTNNNNNKIYLIHKRGHIFNDSFTSVSNFQVYNPELNAKINANAGLTRKWNTNLIVEDTASIYCETILNDIYEVYGNITSESTKIDIDIHGKHVINGQLESQQVHIYPEAVLNGLIEVRMNLKTGLPGIDEYYYTLKNAIQETPDCPWYYDEDNDIFASCSDIPPSTDSEISFIVPSGVYINFQWMIKTPKFNFDYFTILINDNIIATETSLNRTQVYREFWYNVRIPDTKITFRYHRFKNSDNDQAFIKNFRTVNYHIIQSKVYGELYHKSNLYGDLKNNINSSVNGSLSRVRSIIGYVEVYHADFISYPTDSKLISQNIDIDFSGIQLIRNLSGIYNDYLLHENDFTTSESCPWTFEDYGSITIASSTQLNNCLSSMMTYDISSENKDNYLSFELDSYLFGNNDIFRIYADSEIILNTEEISNYNKSYFIDITGITTLRFVHFSKTLPSTGYTSLRNIEIIPKYIFAKMNGILEQKTTFHAYLHSDTATLLSYPTNSNLQVSEAKLNANAIKKNYIYGLYHDYTRGEPIPFNNKIMSQNWHFTETKSELIDMDDIYFFDTLPNHIARVVPSWYSDSTSSRWKVIRDKSWNKTAKLVRYNKSTYGSMFLIETDETGLDHEVSISFGYSKKGNPNTQSNGVKISKVPHFVDLRTFEFLSKTTEDNEYRFRNVKFEPEFHDPIIIDGNGTAYIAFDYFHEGDDVEEYNPYYAIQNIRIIKKYYNHEYFKNYEEIFSSRHTRESNLFKTYNPLNNDLYQQTAWIDVRHVDFRTRLQFELRAWIYSTQGDYLLIRTFGSNSITLFDTRDDEYDTLWSNDGIFREIDLEEPIPPGTRYVEILLYTKEFSNTIVAIRNLMIEPGVRDTGTIAHVDAMVVINASLELIAPIESSYADIEADTEQTERVIHYIDGIDIPDNAKTTGYIFTVGNYDIVGDMAADHATMNMETTHNKMILVIGDLKPELVLDDGEEFPLALYNFDSYDDSITHWIFTTYTKNGKQRIRATSDPIVYKTNQNTSRKFFIEIPGNTKRTIFVYFEYSLDYTGNNYYYVGDERKESYNYIETTLSYSGSVTSTIRKQSNKLWHTTNGGTELSHHDVIQEAIVEGDAIFEVTYYYENEKVDFANPVVQNIKIYELGHYNGATVDFDLDISRFRLIDNDIQSDDADIEFDILETHYLTFDIHTNNATFNSEIADSKLISQEASISGEIIDYIMVRGDLRIENTCDTILEKTYLYNDIEFTSARKWKRDIYDGEFVIEAHDVIMSGTGAYRYFLIEDNNTFARKVKLSFKYSLFKTPISDRRRTAEIRIIHPGDNNVLISLNSDDHYTYDIDGDVKFKLIELHYHAQTSITTTFRSDTYVQATFDPETEHDELDVENVPRIKDIKLETQPFCTYLDLETDIDRYLNIELYADDVSLDKSLLYVKYIADGELVSKQTVIDNGKDQLLLAGNATISGYLDDTYVIIGDINSENASLTGNGNDIKFATGDIHADYTDIDINLYVVSYVIGDIHADYAKTSNKLISSNLISDVASLHSDMIKGIFILEMGEPTRATLSSYGVHTINLDIELESDDAIIYNDNTIYDVGPNNLISDSANVYFNLSDIHVINGNLGHIELFSGYVTEFKQETPLLSWNIFEYEGQLCVATPKGIPQLSTTKISFKIPGKSELGLMWDVITPLTDPDYFKIKVNDEIILTANSIDYDTGFRSLYHKNTSEDEAKVTLIYERKEENRVNRAIVKSIKYTNLSPTITHGICDVEEPEVLSPDPINDSSTTFIIQEIDENGYVKDDMELSNITVEEIRFDIQETTYSLSTDDINQSNTWLELKDAIQNALVDLNLEHIVIDHTNNGIFELWNDNEDAPFIPDSDIDILFSDNDVTVRVGFNLAN